MAKAAAKDDEPYLSDDKAVAPRGEAKATAKPSLANAFADWKARHAKKAQPKTGGGGATVPTEAKGAKVRADDAEAKSSGGSGGSAVQAKPPAPFVAEANRPKAVRSLLDRVVDWYTNDKALALRLETWFFEHATRVPPIDMKRVDEGEFPVEAYGLFQEYTATLEAMVTEFLAAEGGTLEELHALAADNTEVAYSDAWMFVTLFSACTTFLFFADMLKQAQEGDLQFNTTTGLNPKYAI